MPIENPLLSPSTLPYGLPDYSAIRPEHYLPAFEAASPRISRRSPRSPACARCPPSRTRFVALEASGKLLGDVSRTFYTVSSADATPEIQEIEETLAPLMSAHQDSIQLDAALYWRVKTVHDQLDELELEPEQRYLVERHYREMSHAGAGLDDEAKERLTALNQRLSTLTTNFEKNLLNDTNDLAVVFDDVAELDGLTEGELSAAAQAASDRGLEGKWVVTLTLFTGHPYLSSLTDRASRKRDPGRVPLARLARQRERQPRGAARDRAAARRACGAAGLRHARRLHHLRRDGGLPRSRARPAPPARRAGGAQRASASRPRCRRSSTPSREPFTLEAHDWAFYTEKVRAAEYDLDRSRAAPVVRGRARASRTACSAPRRSSTASPSPSAADLSALPPRRAGLRGAQRRRLGARPVHPRPVHARHQARRRVDELDRARSRACAARSPIVVNNLNVPEARARACRRCSPSTR